MVGHHGDVESTLRTAVAERLGEGRFGLWFGEGVRLGVADDALEVGVPNAFFREWIQGHFATNLIEAAEAVTGRTLKLTFRVADEAEPRVGNLIEPKPADERRKHGGTVPLAPEPQTPPQGERERPRNQARPARRLEDFVTGPCNRLAQAAAVEMVQTSGASFNPLVIHAGVGLGKTHLLEGIGHALRSRNPGLKLVQGTAEAFTNGFLDAMRAGKPGIVPIPVSSGRRLDH